MKHRETKNENNEKKMKNDEKLEKKNENNEKMMKNRENT